MSQPSLKGSKDKHVVQLQTAQDMTTEYDNRVRQPSATTEYDHAIRRRYSTLFDDAIRRRHSTTLFDNVNSTGGGGSSPLQ